MSKTFRGKNELEELAKCYRDGLVTGLKVESQNRIKAKCAPRVFNDWIKGKGTIDLSCGYYDKKEVE